MIWNDRPMPASAIASGLKPVIARPSSVTVPRSGSNSPEIRLKAVVLPAPLGPIRACRLRSATAMSTPSTARVPPNDLVSPCARRTGPSARRAGTRNSGSGSAERVRPDIAAASSGRARKGAIARRATPTRPSGENTMKATKSRPNQNSQCGVQIDRNSRNSRKNSAPSAGPRNERMPPITTIARSSPEKATDSGSAEAKRWLNTDSVPASPTTAAETTKPSSA